MATIPIFKLNGQRVQPPRDWTEFGVLATFDKSSVQANITTTELTFVNNARDEIVAWFDSGLNPLSTISGCYQGMPIDISLSDGTNSESVFHGVIDFSDSFNILNSVEVECKLKSFDGLNLLEEQMSGLTFALLEEKGFIKKGDWVDVPYIFEPNYTDLQKAILIITTFMLIRETYFLTLSVAQAISVAFAGLTGTLSSIAFAIATLAYLVALVVQLVKLIQEIKEIIYPTVRHYNGILIQTAIEKVCNFFGLTFQTSLTELDELVFIPSQTRIAPKDFDSSISGSPSVRDDGYIVSNFFDIVKNIFKAKYHLKDNVLHLEPLINDSFWLQQPNAYKLPDVYTEYRKYNVNELNGAYVISFATDIDDSFTKKNYTGTTYEVRTGQKGSFSGSAQINTPNRGSLIKGIEQINIPWALGTRRNDLTAVEELFSGIINIANQLSKFINKIKRTFGGRGNATVFPNAVAQRKDMLKVSEHEIGVAKIMRMKKGIDGQYILPSNYRSIWSAKYLWENYHVESSFVDRNYRNQWRIFENVEVSFGFEDFLALANNSYFYTHDGKLAKAIKFQWNYGKNRAIIDYRVREVFTKNLEEKKYEA